MIETERYSYIFITILLHNIFGVKHVLTYEKNTNQTTIFLQIFTVYIDECERERKRAYSCQVQKFNTSCIAFESSSSNG